MPASEVNHPNIDVILILIWYKVNESKQSKACKGIKHIHTYRRGCTSMQVLRIMICICMIACSEAVLVSRQSVLEPAPVACCRSEGGRGSSIKRGGMCVLWTSRDNRRDFSTTTRGFVDRVYTRILAKHCAALSWGIEEKASSYWRWDRVARRLRFSIRVYILAVTKHHLFLEYESVCLVQDYKSFISSVG